MFYLRTGANGTCKTLFTLADIRKLQLETGRPVAFNKNFKPKPILTDEFGWTLLEDFAEWEQQPKGTIFLIDEAYKDLPVRPNGQKPPKHIERLAEHRSMGYDFFFLALHPKQIDSWLRDTIAAPGWHQHLKRVGGASNLTRVLQWDEVNISCHRNGSGKTAQIENRIQPKEVYEWYDSAFIHTGKLRIPKQVWYFIAGSLLAVVLAVFAYKSLVGNTIKKPSLEVQAAAGAASAPVAGGGAGGGDKPKPMTTAEYVQSFQPRIEGLAYTAPRYDAVTAPVTAPMPAACVDGRKPGAKVKTCHCWTQQATVLPVPESLCRQIAAGGFFDDTLQPSKSDQVQQRTPMASGSPGPIQPLQQQVAVLDNSPVLTPPETKSTVQRDGEVLAFMRKREYIK